MDAEYGCIACVWEMVCVADTSRKYQFIVVVVQVESRAVSCFCNPRYDFFVFGNERPRHFETADFHATFAVQ